MATLHFDGADDWLRGTGQGGMSGAITLAVLHRRTGAYAGHYSALLGGATSANARSFMLAYDQVASPEKITLFDNTTNRYNQTTIADTNTDWWVLVYTKAAGTVAPRWHLKNLTTGAAAIHEAELTGGTNVNFPSCSGGYLKIGNYDLTPGNPGSAEEDFLGDIALVAWWDGTALSDAQCNELWANSKTSDWANNSAGAPSSLTQLTSTSPTDLKGLVTWTTTGAVATGPDPTGWTFNGLGYAGTILGTAGLAGYWRLGESVGTNANDETANNNDGTYTTVTLSQAGAISGDVNTAVSVGATGKIEIPDIAAMPQGTANSTVEFWLFPSAMASYATVVDVTNRAFALFLNADNTLDHAFGGHGGTTGYLTATGTGTGPLAVPFTLNEWQHVCLVRRSGVTELWRNGVLVGSGAWAGVNAMASPLTFGTNPSAGGGRMTGSYDEIATYTVALSGATILDHYTVGDGLERILVTAGTFDAELNVKAWF